MGKAVATVTAEQGDVALYEELNTCSWPATHVCQEGS